MRISCNGCRVLRKGCSDNCILRSCLGWIRSPESQANATLFLAKFYGRAGLLNLINAGPEHLRPAVFRSLLYEACGRIVNPTYGSAGLLWSSSWQLCHAAVEAVLKGEQIVQGAPGSPGIPVDLAKACDVRHVSKEESAANQELHRVRARGKFKARKKRGRSDSGAADLVAESDGGSGSGGGPSHDSSLSHPSEPNAETEMVGQAELDSRASGEELDLTLGLGELQAENAHLLDDMDKWGLATCNLDLGLRLGGN